MMMMMMHAAILKVHVIVIGRLLCRSSIAVEQPRLPARRSAHWRWGHRQWRHCVRSLAAGTQRHSLMMRQDVRDRVR